MPRHAEMGSAGIATACAAFLGITVVVFGMVHGRQADPYMDEIFHVPQAQAYCEGNFTQVRHECDFAVG